MIQTTLEFPPPASHSATIQLPVGKTFHTFTQGGRTFTPQEFANHSGIPVVIDGTEYRPKPVASFVRMFKPRFAPLVESGAKLQTVRPLPARLPQPGDRISLRTWTGLPYRSKQRILRESIIERVAFCNIGTAGIRLDDYHVPPDDFARADGFRDFADLLAWFEETHALPFAGIAIFWRPVS